MTKAKKRRGLRPIAANSPKRSSGISTTSAANRNQKDVSRQRESQDRGAGAAAVPAADFPGFCQQPERLRQTLERWREKHGDFAEAYDRAKDLQEAIWLVNALSGQYNAQFSQFFARSCLGYRDKRRRRGAGLHRASEEVMRLSE
jgi:hypothetical protein